MLVGETARLRAPLGRRGLLAAVVGVAAAPMVAPGREVTVVEIDDGTAADAIEAVLRRQVDRIETSLEELRAENAAVRQALSRCAAVFAEQIAAAERLGVAV